MYGMIGVNYKAIFRGALNMSQSVHFGTVPPLKMLTFLLYLALLFSEGMEEIAIISKGQKEMK
jgi:hypothetical protein